MGKLILFGLTVFLSMPHVEAKPLTEVKPAPSVSAAIPKDFKSMLERFSRAVTKNDKKVLVELSKFPLRNTVYEQPPQKSQKEFESDTKNNFAGFCYGAESPKKEEKNEIEIDTEIS